MLDLRVRAFLLALVFACSGIAAFGQQHTVTLHGKLFQGEGECSFFLDGDGDSESIQAVSFSAGSYLCDYFAGSNARAFVVTFSPRP